jgi:hypothetical protein
MAQLLDLVVNDVKRLKLEDLSAGEEGVQGSATSTVDIVGDGGEGGRFDSESAVEAGIFVKVGLYAKNRIVVLWVGEMDFIWRDAHDWACES